MKKKECPSCAMEVDSNSQTCPICQYEFTTGNSMSSMKWVALFLALLFLLYALFF